MSTNTGREWAAALAKATVTHTLNREEIGMLLQTEGEPTVALYQAADQVRTRYMGKAVHLRAIIEISNRCVQNCLYCGLRRDNRALPRYRMSPEEILAAARRAHQAGYRTIVLQSGEDPAYDAADLAWLVRRLKDELEVAVTLSLGDRSQNDYDRLWEAGADRYLLKHETSDPALFAYLRPGTTLDERLQKLGWLRELGYQVGAGNMVGLPGQTLETLADDILLLRELGVEMAGIGPFIPHPRTPLAAASTGSLEMTLKVLALTRLLLPDAHLPATTALAALPARASYPPMPPMPPPPVHTQEHANRRLVGATADPAPGLLDTGRRRALQVGANVIMPDLTPASYRRHYDLYPGRTRPLAEEATSFSWWKQEMAVIGREIASGYGHAHSQAEAHDQNTNFRK
jgi:biotin synthase